MWHQRHAHPHATQPQPHPYRQNHGLAPPFQAVQGLPPPPPPFPCFQGLSPPPPPPPPPLSAGCPPPGQCYQTSLYNPQVQPPDHRGPPITHGPSYGGRSSPSVPSYQMTKATGAETQLFAPPSWSVPDNTLSSRPPPPTIFQPSLPPPLASGQVSLEPPPLPSAPVQVPPQEFSSGPLSPSPPLRGVGQKRSFQQAFPPPQSLGGADPQQRRGTQRPLLAHVPRAPRFGPKPSAATLTGTGTGTGPLLSGPSLGLASPVLADLSKKKAFVESLMASDKGKETLQDSEVLKELIETASEALQVLVALDVCTLPVFLERIRPLQTEHLFVGAIPADIPANTKDSSLTDTCRILFDSLVGKIVDSLMDGKSWGGALHYHQVLVTEGRCVIMVVPDQLANLDNTEKDLKFVHGLIDRVFTEPYPPHLGHLLKLLTTVPRDYDTDLESRKRYLLSVKHHCSLASLGRIVTLLLNFAQCKNCLPEKVLKKLRLALAREMNPEVFSSDWTKKLDRHKLLKDVRKRPKKKKKTKTDPPPQPDVNDLFDLSYFFRTFTVHAPDYMLNSNDEVQLEDYVELYHILVHHFGNVVPDLVTGMFRASDLHPL
ncbi:hypothetical protein ACQ4PT_059577 [Festuca glaucescens]